jgi:hypothetical protein
MFSGQSFESDIFYTDIIFPARIEPPSTNHLKNGIQTRVREICVNDPRIAWQEFVFRSYSFRISNLRPAIMSSYLLFF